MTTYILDTNILLGDPRAIFAFKNCEIVLPYKVIEELEKHKNSLGALGMSARDCSRILSNLIETSTENDLISGITLETKSVLKAIQLDKALVKDEMPDCQSGDDYILATCIMLAKQDKDIVLVSNDMLLKIRANTFKITTAAYDKQTQVNSLDEVFSGFNVIPPEDALIDEFWRQKQQHTSAFDYPKERITSKELFPNEFVVFASDLTQKSYPTIRFNKEKDNFKFVAEKKITGLKSMNIEQTMALDLLMDQDIDLVTLTGPSGTGKTLVALAAGLEQVVEKRTYEKLIIIRPTHAVGKDIGYLPGTLAEKLEPWIAPIKDNLKVLMSTDKKSTRGGAGPSPRGFEFYFEEGLIEIQAMTYIRGRSINNAYIVIDEAQNLNQHELKAILTRAGHGTKIVLTGDIEQTDRSDVDSISNGLTTAIEKFKQLEFTGHVTLTKGLRSRLATAASKIL